MTFSTPCGQLSSQKIYPTEPRGLSGKKRFLFNRPGADVKLFHIVDGLEVPVTDGEFLFVDGAGQGPEDHVFVGEEDEVGAACVGKQVILLVQAGQGLAEFLGAEEGRAVQQQGNLADDLVGGGLDLGVARLGAGLLELFSKCHGGDLLVFAPIRSG